MGYRTKKETNGYGLKKFDIPGKYIARKKEGRNYVEQVVQITSELNGICSCEYGFVSIHGTTVHKSNVRNLTSEEKTNQYFQLPQQFYQSCPY